MLQEEKIQELLKRLFDLKYTWKGSMDSYTEYIIKKENRSNIESVLRAFLLDSRDERTGILEAKVFTYEQIISKSNFSTILISEEKEQEPEHLHYHREMLFTQTQIEHLRHNVFKITGQSKVIDLFDELLCIPKQKINYYEKLTRTRPAHNQLVN